MPKKLIAFIIVAAIGFATAAIFFMKESAAKARKESDRILEEFKVIDKDVQKTTIAIDSVNKTLPDSLSGKK
jgi:Cu/Ag efflux protein CusF